MHVLKANDILLAFDGEPIGNDGTVRFRKHERVMCSWLVAALAARERTNASDPRVGIMHFMQVCATSSFRKNLQRASPKVEMSVSHQETPTFPVVLP